MTHLELDMQAWTRELRAKANRYEILASRATAEHDAFEAGRYSGRAQEARRLADDIEAGF